VMETVFACFQKHRHQRRRQKLVAVQKTDVANLKCQIPLGVHRNNLDVVVGYLVLELLLHILFLEVLNDKVPVIIFQVVK